MEGFSKTLMVILAVLLLVVAPIQALARTQAGVENMWHEQKTRELVEEVGRLGYLSVERYELFTKEIQSRGSLWDIELVHAKEKTGFSEGEALSMRTIQEEYRISALKLAANRFVGHTHTEECYTHTHTERTDDAQGRYYCTHTHTDACKSNGWSRTHFTTCEFCNVWIDMYCYEFDQSGKQINAYSIFIPAGSKCPSCGRGLSSQQRYWQFYYTCGYSQTTITSGDSVPPGFKTPQVGSTQSGWFREPNDQYTYGCYRYSEHDHEAERCEGYLSRKTIPVICRSCSSILGVLVEEYAKDGSLISIYRPDELYMCCGVGITEDFSQTIEDYTYSCGKSSDWELICQGEIEAVTPICDSVILAITPLETAQTLYVGDALNTEVSVKCLSGNTFTMQGSAEFSAAQAGTFTVEIFLDGYTDNAKTTGRKKAEISVTVIPREKKCDNGHTYTLNSDGSDPGCLVCQTTVTQIEPHLLVQEMYKGDTLPLKGITVTYLDGHTEYLKEGYEVCFDREKTGTITLRIQYKNGEAATELFVKPNPVSLKVTPEVQNIIKYQTPGFLVMVLYEDGSSKNVDDYEVLGIRNGQSGVQNGSVRYTENGITVSREVKVNVLPLSATCAYGHVYDRDSNDISWGCPVCKNTLTSLEAAPSIVYGAPGDALNITVIALFQDGHTQVLDDYECNYDPTKKGEQTVVIRWRDKETTLTAVLTEYRNCPVCGHEISIEEECPYCAKVPVWIFAEPANQTVFWGEEPEFAVWVEYQDGHQERTYDYRHTFRENIAGSQEVDIYYAGFTAKVRVTVKDRDAVICSACGLEYKKSDSPEGCPSCRKELIRIEAEPEGSSVMIRGSTLNVRVILHYRAGNQEIIYSGYTVKHYDPMKTGYQEVEIWYQEKKAGFVVEVVEAMTEVVCGNGHRYFSNQDGSDPGCPVCLGEEEKYTLEYLDIYYTSQILDELFANGIYSLQEGDYFSVRLVKKKKSFAEKLAAGGIAAEAESNMIRYSSMIAGEKENNEGI